MANKKEWKFSTKAIHVGNEADKMTGPFHLPSILLLHLSRMLLDKLVALITPALVTQHVNGWSKI